MKGKLAKAWPWFGLLSGVAGIAVLLRAVDVSAVAAALASANPVLLGLAGLLLLITVAIRTLRWIYLFRQSKVNIPFRRLLSILFIDSFYGQFLPASSAVGATMLFAEGTKRGASGVDVIATVLVERVFNLVAILGAASLLLLVAQPAGLPSALTLTILLAFIGSVVALVCLQRGWGIGSLGRMLARLKLPKLGQHIVTLSQTLQCGFGHPGVLGRALALSALVNACMMIASYLVTIAVVGAVPTLSFLAMAALIAALQGMPLTPGSLGVREGLYVFFLGLLGVSEPRALTIGLLVMMLYWFQGLTGGLILLRSSLPNSDLQILGRIRFALFPRRRRSLGVRHEYGA